MKYCPECGEKAKIGAKFCSSCGNEITSKEREITKPAKEVIVERKSGGGLGWLFGFVIIIGIVGAVIFFSQSHSTGSFTDVAKVVYSPRLSISNVDGNFGWDFGKGCFATIKGVVYNGGNANAESTSVRCDIYKKSGGLLDSGSTSVGTVYSNGNQAFSLLVDFSCLSAISESDTSLDCKAECSNC